ncbi:hypothetical protein CONPUDRAFT_84591 [Coniophora puteana RWD-64-598 SS2]|uniref:Uncharacterized protein n=1 Tax=Coniophora puteana (strain RWD-64-598) TaxID=741705 RepID=A0A5M3MDA9_CONPW|nr:uncharacterized protein CONPUDRAFT_84591 [Coniophora puteana RWD-64-598 SS2]EIW76615.1 hypothetical protein CONPUDRAFT_84591 [Coniophora puteana RWD-64-598 SS2]
MDHSTLQLLADLRSYLETLPDNLPITSKINFAYYQPNDVDIKDKGYEGAVNHALEMAFCPQSRRDGPIVLKERGPGLVAVVDVLQDTIAKCRAQSEKSSDSAIMLKWARDLIHQATGLHRNPSLYRSRDCEWGRIQRVGSSTSEEEGKVGS